MFMISIDSLFTIRASGPRKQWCVFDTHSDADMECINAILTIILEEPSIHIPRHDQVVKIHDSSVYRMVIMETEFDHMASLRKNSCFSSKPIVLLNHN